MTGEAGTATVYQPQVVAWPDRQMLQTRVAMAVTPTGAKAAAYGTVDVAFTTSTDLASRTVTLTNPKLIKTQFPTLDTGQAVNVEDRIKAALDNLGEKRVPLTSSSGAMGAGARGAGGNSAGAVKTAGGDVYAGADGNVYRKTDDGWSKYNNGSWTPVQPPMNTRSATGQANTASGASGSGAQRASPSTASSQGNLSGATERPYASGSAARDPSQGDLSGTTARPYASASVTRTARQGDLSGETERGAAWRGGGSRSEGWSQLENDRGARAMGAQRQQELGAMRERGFGGGSFGGRGFEGGGFRR